LAHGGQVFAGADRRAGLGSNSTQPTIPVTNQLGAAPRRCSARGPSLPASSSVTAGSASVGLQGIKPADSGSSSGSARANHLGGVAADRSLSRPGGPRRGNSAASDPETPRIAGWCRSSRWSPAQLMLIRLARICWLPSLPRPSIQRPRAGQGVVHTERSDGFHLLAARPGGGGNLWLKRWNFIERATAGARALDALRGVRKTIELKVEALPPRYWLGPSSGLPAPPRGEEASGSRWEDHEDPASAGSKPLTCAIRPHLNPLGGSIGESNQFDPLGLADESRWRRQRRRLRWRAT